MFLFYVFYLITLLYTQSKANVDIKVVIEKITTELGSGRLTVSSYLHYTAEHCLEHLDKSLTVGQESLNCYANAYKTLNETQNETQKSEKPTKATTEAENWERQCKVWPLLSACHRKTTLPATDQCYQELLNKTNRESGRNDLNSHHQSAEAHKRGSEALHFTDAYIDFQCKNISRIIDVLELARPRRLICFKDLKEQIMNCSKKAAEAFEFELLQFSLRRALLLIRNCYEAEYTKYAEYCSLKNTNAGKVVPFIKDMFDYIDKEMFKHEHVKLHALENRSSEAHTKKTMDEKQIEETKKNIDEKIKDEILKDFLTNIIIPDEAENNSSETSNEIINDSPFTSVTFEENQELEDHRVFPGHDPSTTAHPNQNDNNHNHKDSNDAKELSNSSILLHFDLLLVFLVIFKLVICGIF